VGNRPLLLIVKGGRRRMDGKDKGRIRKDRAFAQLCEFLNSRNPYSPE